VAYPVKLGVGIRDGERWYDIWIKGPVTPAASIAEYEASLIGYLLERIEEMSPTSAVPILSATSQVYQLVMRCHNDELEMWYTPQESFGDNTLPSAHQVFQVRIR
jgi:hypothetical protein